MFLKSIASAVPPHVYSQSDCWDAIRNSSVAGKLRSRSLKLLEKVLLSENGIERRHLCLPDPSQIFERDAEALNREFERYAPQLATEAVESALDKAGIRAADLDALFTCTCTGYLCPGVSSHVAEKLGCRSDTSLHDIVGLGCGAAIPLMRSAENFLAANPGAKVATVAVEVCSAAFYVDDDPGVLISLCLFADAASAAVWSGDEGGNGQWRTGDWQTLHQPEHREKIRFVNSKGALKNQLHRSVPGLSSKAVQQLYQARRNYSPSENGSRPRIISHSGGRDVIDAIEAELGLTSDQSLTESREVLRDFGNCSSPSALLALERYLERKTENDSQSSIWLTSFGAGFTAHACELTKA